MYALRSFMEYFHLWVCQALVDLPGPYSAVAGSLSAIGRELLLRCVRVCTDDLIRKLLLTIPAACLSMIACPE